MPTSFQWTVKKVVVSWCHWRYSRSLWYSTTRFFPTSWYSIINKTSLSILYWILVQDAIHNFSMARQSFLRFLGLELEGNFAKFDYILAIDRHQGHQINVLRTSILLISYHTSLMHDSTTYLSWSGMKEVIWVLWIRCDKLSIPLCSTLRHTFLIFGSDKTRLPFSANKTVHREHLRHRAGHEFEYFFIAVGSMFGWRTDEIVSNSELEYGSTWIQWWS